MILRDFFDKLKPNFSKGGRFEKLSSTFEAFESFAFTPNTVTGGKVGGGYKGSHIRDAVDLKRTIITVVIALLPALLFGMWNIGHQTATYYGLDWGFWHQWWFGFLRMLPIIVVSYLVGLGIEFLFAEIRHEEVSEGFIGTGLIISMIVPVTVPSSATQAICRATACGWQRHSTLPATPLPEPHLLVSLWQGSRCRHRHSICSSEPSLAAPARHRSSPFCLEHCYCLPQALPAGA